MFGEFHFHVARCAMKRDTTHRLLTVTFASTFNYAACEGNWMEREFNKLWDDKEPFAPVGTEMLPESFNALSPSPFIKHFK